MKVGTSFFCQVWKNYLGEWWGSGEVTDKSTYKRKHNENKILLGKEQVPGLGQGQSLGVRPDGAPRAFNRLPDGP